MFLFVCLFTYFSDQTSLELTILFSQILEFWGDKYLSHHPATVALIATTIRPSLSSFIDSTC